MIHKLKRPMHCIVQKPTGVFRIALMRKRSPRRGRRDHPLLSQCRSEMAKSVNVPRRFPSRLRTTSGMLLTNYVSLNVDLWQFPGSLLRVLSAEGRRLRSVASYGVVNQLEQHSATLKLINGKARRLKRTAQKDGYAQSAIACPLCSVPFFYVLRLIKSTYNLHVTSHHVC